MRIVTTLAIINAAVWLAFVMLFPGSHFATPGTYNYWWFDDLPWGALLVSGLVPVCLMAAPIKPAGKLISGLIALLIIALAAVIPYAALSGGGV